MCVALCTTVAHNIAQNTPDNFLSYPPDNHHCSDDVYLREGGLGGVQPPVLLMTASSPLLLQPGGLAVTFPVPFVPVM